LAGLAHRSRELVRCSFALQDTLEASPVFCEGLVPFGRKPQQSLRHLTPKSLRDLDIASRLQTGKMAYDWGGFLIWALPGLPVSMDGRANLYGDDRVLRNMNTWDARPEWSLDPDLAAARLIIANRRASFTGLLRLCPKYRAIYEDNLAVVFQTASYSKVNNHAEQDSGGPYQNTMPEPVP
jgi:hypothetical protein